MQTVGKTVLEALALAVLAVAVAFGVNGVRAQGSVRFSRNYFHKTETESKPSLLPAGTLHTEDAQPGGHTGKPLKHPFREVSFDDVVTIFNDPNTERCLNVFIDARNDAAYQDGHIPGAIQADHYRLDACIDLVLAYVQGAEKVIVYCNGGDCEDSLFLCSDLSELDVPNGKLYLYRGGWAEWETKGMPVATGKTPRGD